MDDLDQVVLYHGSLEELNSRDPKKQYKFAEAYSFVSKDSERLGYGWYDAAKYGLPEKFSVTAKELKELGYDGLANMRMVVYCVERSSPGAGPGSVESRLIVEGTPIIKVLPKT